MTSESVARSELRIAVVPGFEKSMTWPQVRYLVDGVDLFVVVHGDSDWLGLDPDTMLDPDAPLIPNESGRRVILLMCSCAEIGCGSFSASIEWSPDGDRVVWTAGRWASGESDVVVVPDSDRLDDWPSPRSHPLCIEFDRQQYLDEVARATADRRWETDSRITARLLADRLRPLDIVVEPDFRFQRCSPDDRNGGIRVSYLSPTVRPHSQQLLTVDSLLTDPVARADDIAERMLSVDPQRWAVDFPPKW